MNRNRKKTFILAVAIPLLILISLTIKPVLTVLYGKEILLETRAVDPNDLFRGDYVALAFRISDLPRAMLPESVKQYTNNKTKDFTLYAKLKQEGQYYVVDSLSEDKPNSGLYLKGKLRYYNYYGDDKMPPTFYIDYSLDRYFVKQGLGKELQTYSSRGELVGTVKVFNGYGILTDVKPSGK